MKKVLIIIPVLIIAVILVLGFSLNSIIKGGVETIGPKVTGVDVRLNKADVSLFSGKGQLQGLFIGNPSGFQTDSAFKLNEVRIALNVKSVFSDKIIIDEVYINAPDITYETSGKTDNIQSILKNIKKGSGSAGTKDKPSAAKDASGSGKKIIIKKFLLTNGKVNMSSTLMKGEAISLDLPEIELKDIGQDKGGTTVSDAMEKIFAALNKNILGTVTGSLKDIGKQLEDTAGKVAEDTINKAVGEDVGKSLKKFFGK
jgi:uncharacterized protein involved in outer membrane biogenesis